MTSVNPARINRYKRNEIENDYENKNDNSDIDAGGIIDLVSTITSSIRHQPSDISRLMVYTRDIFKRD